MEKTYTKKEVLEMIEEAFWDGVKVGEISVLEDDYAGENFSAEYYLKK